MVSIEDLVPQDHLLRQISDAVDFSKIYEFVEELYCDKNGFVIEAVVTPGNVHDSVAFDDVYDKLAENYPEIETIVADSAYKTPHICKKYLMTAE